MLHINRIDGRGRREAVVQGAVGSGVGVLVLDALHLKVIVRGGLGGVSGMIIEASSRAEAAAAADTLT